MIKNLLFALFLLHATAATAAQPLSAASDYQDLAKIRSTADDFVREQTARLPGKVSYHVDDIDRRLVFPKCARLEAFLPEGSKMIGNTNIGVRCAPQSGKATWSLYVSVQIRHLLNTLISMRPLQPGYTLQDQDIGSQLSESSQPGELTDPNQVVGKVLRKYVAQGQVLRTDMLREPFAVTQNQVVQLMVRGNGFSIRSEGVAQKDAAEGEIVRVRIASGRFISGVARAGGTVEVRP